MRGEGYDGPGKVPIMVTYPASYPTGVHPLKGGGMMDRWVDDGGAS